jgi:DNA-binding XRE family transcriptional regulator
MADGGSNRVRELREARGLSQVTLAATVGLTRQSVHAIETGRATPAVDVALRIARALDCPVESLFGATAADARLTTEAVTEAKAGRVALAHISGRWLSYSLDREGIGRSADALAAKTKGGNVEVDELRPSSESRENVVIMGCAVIAGQNRQEEVGE